MVARRFSPHSLLVLAAVLASASCSISFPSHEEPENEPKIIALSVADGAAVYPGQLVTVLLTLEEQDGQSGDPASRQVRSDLVLEIVVLDDSGVEVSRELLPVDPEQEVPPLSLDELELATGRYTLSVRLLSAGEALAEEKIEFTYVSGRYEVAELYCDSPVVHPGSAVRLRASFGVPADADPFVRWTAAGVVVDEGWISGGMEEISWTAPEREGVYTVSVAVYALNPGVTTVTPAASLATEVYVVRFADGSDGDLEPPESYYSLFHFNGDLQDTGAASLAASLRSRSSFMADRKLKLVTHGKTVGYELDGEGGIRIPYLILPLESGGLAPATITVGLTPAGESPEGSLLSVLAGDGSPLCVRR